ncbi:MAG: ATP-binding protein [Leptospiraceae bacterium]|nr:ATP-binding protein [Leptospiraceae bacterium]
MTEEEFDTILRNSEHGKVEFKGKVNFNEYKNHFAVALISLANSAGGGMIVVGVNDKNPHEREGLTSEELKSFDKKLISDSLKNKVSPIPDFEREIFETQGFNVLIFYVKEFTDVPHIIINNFEFNGRKFFPGDILIRTKSSESRKVQSENEIRELIGLAVRKRSELLLGEIKSIITGKIEKIEDDPNELFYSSLPEFEELAAEFKNSQNGLVYWKFQLVPIPLAKRNFNLLEHLQKSLVTKGMNTYPNYNSDTYFIHDSLIFKNSREYWRLSKNLCYGGYRGLFTESSSYYPNRELPVINLRPIPIELVVINLMEYLTFCKNLIFDETIDSVWINIELKNTANRYLGYYENPPFGKYEYQEKKCLSTQIKMNDTISKGDLLSSYKDIAIEYILRTLRNFQHNNVSSSDILNIYNHYLKK